MPLSDIVVRGAREHNLRSVSVSLPRNKLICLTGVSGSGKSSLAFDTLYAEGQRRYVESLSSFARQFLGQMPKPDVDLISGLSPSISISQKSTGHNPRSTVGTITEIYDYLRVLFARIGQGHCTKCGEPITAQTREQIIEQILALGEGTSLSVLAPLIRRQKGEYRDLFADLLKQGFIRARVDGNVVSLSDDLKLDRQMRHDIAVAIDRLSVKPGVRARLAEAVDLAMKMGKGNLVIAVEHAASTGGRGTSATPPNTENRTPNTESRDILFSTAYACVPCGLSFEPPSPQLFSFNSPQGMCPTCDGLGQQYTFAAELLIPSEDKSFKDGAIETIGPWKELGRWRRHIFQGVADTMERKLGLDEGTMLETPWVSLAAELRHLWLYGTGDEHITFTWRQGNSPQKYGGKYEGIIPELLTKYSTSQSKMHQRALEKYMSTIGCPECGGQRLNAQARAAKVTSASSLYAAKPSLTLPEICSLPVNAASEYFSSLVLSPTQQVIAEEALKEIRGRLGFLMNVGLDYLALDRTAPTLSGGESQRIRLAGQIGCGLVGVLYILDEPSIGLHPRDNDRLINTLCQLRDMGNTVLVVEHDEDTMRAADHLVDFGPGPGVRGGEIVGEGTAAEVAKAKRSVTGAFLSGERSIKVPELRRISDFRFQISDLKKDGAPKSAKSEIINLKSEIEPTGKLRIVGARQNNLKNVTVDVPLGAFVCVTGVSGSGKSSLVNDILVAALHRDLNKGEGEVGAHDRIEGIEQLDKMIAIDQSPIGRTPRSNPGTYIKVFDDIRNLFTQLPDSKRRGYKSGRFSFNVEGGRCEACEGNGSNKLEMDFLADIWVTCPVCQGHRFNRETLGVRFKEKSIAEVLEMDVQEALELFTNQPKIAHKLQTLHDVGLDYLKIGQPSPTLSGGEAQRIKLARELVKKSTGKTIYFLDEPTTGLHFADIEMLLKVLHDFVDAGNTVVVVEHNLDVIKTADWLIDLGPEGGAGGGEILICGTPEEVAAHPQSHTGRALAEILGVKASAHAVSKFKRSAAPKTVSPSLTEIKVRGAAQHNLKHVDVTIPRDAMSVFCGPSGSGKTSLAMDTIYAEGQRRYVESLSAYARQFVGQMQKPKLEHIEGLSPAIAIEQKNLGHTPRSTVGTVTEIYDYFRILYARLGQMHCPDCDVPVGTQTSDEIIDKVMSLADGTKIFIMAPVEVEVGRKYETLWDELRGQGYSRVRVDGATHSLDSAPEIDRRRKHRVEVVVDRAIVKKSERSRIAESVENALALGRGVMTLALASDNVPESRWETVTHSQHRSCEKCGRSFEPLTPHSFSFNSFLGWCNECQGLGTQVGANPAALVRDGKLTLAEGALAMWPNLAQPIARAMLEALARETGVPLDVPLDQLNARQRRFVMHGTGEAWINVDIASSSRKSMRNHGADNFRSPFRYQFKGLYPALEEASKLSPTFRARLEQFVDEVPCTACSGSRLRDDAAAVRFTEKTIDEICRMPLGDLFAYVKGLKFNAAQKKIAGELLREITGRLEFLCDVGLEYLTLARSAPTLSAGEAQRIRLASQLGSGLCGVLYVLDEPTIGLHPRDNTKLLRAMHKLRDLGNTLLVVEHDKEVIEGCDRVFDFGPAAGKHGGQIVADATPKQLLKAKGSVTGPYLSGRKAIVVPTNRRLRNADFGLRNEENANAKSKRKAKPKTSDKSAIRNPQSEFKPPGGAWLEVIGARQNNLRNVDVRIPLGTFTAVTGPSGSGKSSLIEEVLYSALAKRLHRANVVPGAHDEIRGAERINKVIRVDQKPLGNSPASNPATYTGLFELIRDLFSQLPEAKLRGYTGRRFSFNVPGGRCEACEGEGQVCIEMHFLPDVWVECETCRGRRYNPETLAVTYHGHSIADVLAMTCGEALQLFTNIPKIRRVLQTLCDVGLDYLQLGQPAPTLSGGEAQRVKLAAELSRPDTGQTLYLLDEPTTGLHFDDLAKLLEVLHRLVDLGNTVVVIEHNLDVIKQCDWIIDMGPEAGEGGGRVVACGTPEIIAEIADFGLRNAELKKGSSKRSPNPQSEFHNPQLRSHTAEALAPIIAAGPHEPRKAHDFAADLVEKEGDLEIEDVGENTAMPWQVDGRQWHCHDRVGRRGEACKWDGRILERVIDRIYELGAFSATNWDSRTVVEVCAEKKSEGWFFHAITGEAWLLKMKFRVAKGTFKREELQARIPLATLNDMHDLPIYSNEPRVKVHSGRGPWQEVEIRAHTLEEIDIPGFWQFIEQAVAGFNKQTDRVAQKPEDVMPWKVLGQKWHLSRKGFRPGKKVLWETQVLDELLELLNSAAPDGQFLWNNQLLVHLVPSGQSEPWATVYTKKNAAIELHLRSPKGVFALGRISEMGRSRELDATNARRDVMKFHFRTSDDVHRGGLAEFLAEHVASLDEKAAARA